MAKIKQIIVIRVAVTVVVFIYACSTLGAVASMFWVDAELGSDLYLDGKMSMAHGHVFFRSLSPSPLLFYIF